MEINLSRLTKRSVEHHDVRVRPADRNSLSGADEAPKKPAAGLLEVSESTRAPLAGNRWQIMRSSRQQVFQH